jgi:hypothetical protein
MCLKYEEPCAIQGSTSKRTVRKEKVRAKKDGEGEQRLITLEGLWLLDHKPGNWAQS